jgi:hypothetical protein
MPPTAYYKKDKGLIIGQFATLRSGKCCIYGACSHASKNDMKKRIVMYALLLPVTFLFIGHCAIAQDSPTRSDEENARIDSLAKAYNQQEAVKDQDRRESEDLLNLKAEKKETKAKAREAQRVESEANDAARESKIAYRQEKKAQRARAQADRQAKKAAKARIKSDKN